MIDGVGNEIAHDLPYEHYFDSANAAYIVHACNNFPQLVAALRSVTQSQNGTAHAADVLRAAALLRSLGEES
mgnify:CR=1 FL=1